jgi:hypothetical protein
MSIRATVRVKNTESQSQRPEKQAVESAAKMLKELGFDVLRVGRFGVSIEGADERFSDVFGVQVEPANGLVSKVNPKQRKLADLVDLVEVAPEPKKFA